VSAFTNMSDSSFAMIFSAIMLMASVPTGLEFWQKVKTYYSDYVQKLEMLKTGATADEIVRSLLSQSVRESITAGTGTDG
jgi:TnpA family transposase